MTIEAAAQALAPESVSTPEDDMGAVWDRMQGEQDNSPDTTTQAPQEAVEPESVEEPAQAENAQEKPEEGPKTDAPTGLPRGLKEHWAQIPEAARDELQRVTKEWNDRLSEQGRLVQGIAPIRDVLVEIAKDVPQYAGMKPHEVAADLRAFRANVIEPLEKQPVETLLKVAKERGVAEQLRAALGGETPQGAQETQQLMQVINGLQRKIEQLENPEFWAERVSTITQQGSLQNEVESFASNTNEAPHWGEVEEHIPAVIPLMRAKMGQQASPRDVLKAAYNEAVRLFVPDAEKATEAAPVEEAEALPDPEQAEKARKAKSVNVTGKPSKPRPLTEDELMANVWDKAHKR